MTRTLEERREIARTITERAFAENPHWSNAIQATPPASLAGVRREHLQVANLPIREPVLSVLAGTITGDTTLALDKGYANARIKAKHSTQQYSWFTWKYRHVLKDYTLPTGVTFLEPEGYQLKATSRFEGIPIGKLQIASKAHSDLTALYEILCPTGKKTIARSWLNHMTDYYLMTVWLDDGGLSTEQGRQGRISLDSFPLTEQNIFRKYLQVVWNIETTHVNTNKRMQNGEFIYKIDIANLESLMRLLRIVAPIVPVREMLYKVCLMPTDKELLQRWRSELLGLVKPEFVVYVQDYYNRRLADNLPNLD